MANDYNNKNELVPGDDTTAELEALTDPYLSSAAGQAELDADTCNFDAVRTTDKVRLEARP